MARWKEFYDHQRVYRAELAARLRELMNEQGLNSTQLDKMCGVSAQTINTILHEQRTVSNRTLLKIETALKATLSTVPQNILIPIYKLKYLTEDTECNKSPLKKPEKNEQLPLW